MNKPMHQKQKLQLRRQAHTLKPLVIIGDKGLTENVLRELDLTLEHHELIKIRVNAGDRAARQELINKICQETNSTLVQCIGHVACLYRRSAKLLSAGRSFRNDR